MIAVLIHITLSLAFAYIGSSIFGALSLGIAVASLIVSAVLARNIASGFSTLDWKFFSFPRGEAGLLEVSLFSLIIFVGVRHCIWILAPVDHGFATLDIFNYGDLPMHLGYIRNLARGAYFPPVNPGFASEPLRYPFGLDLYQALWDTLGLNLSANLAYVSTALLLVSLLCLKRFGGWWAIGGFFLGGGMIGWNMIGHRVSYNLLQDMVDWKNLFLTVFITQRGMQLALPLGLFLLMVIREFVAGRIQLKSRDRLWIGVMWGFLSLVHLHTFIAISLLLAGHTLIENGVAGLKKLFVSRIFFTAFLPATYFVLRSSDGLQKAGIIHWHAWWGYKGDGLSTYLGLNFGFWLLLPLAIAAVLIFRKSMPEKQRRIYMSLLVFDTLLFILFLNLIFAPWEWDNIKLLIWPFLALTRLAWLVVDPILPRFSRTVIAIALFFTGFTSLMGSIDSQSSRLSEIYTNEILASTEGAIKKVPVQSVFAAATSYNHPLSYFGGIRVADYEGHLWTHGIQADPTIIALREVMKGEGDWLSTARKLHVDYIFWGPQERTLYGDAHRPWMDDLKNVSDVDGFEVYQVKDKE
jgi:hypothetical protein